MVKISKIRYLNYIFLIIFLDFTIVAIIKNTTISLPLMLFVNLFFMYQFFYRTIPKPLSLNDWMKKNKCEKVKGKFE